MFTIGQAVTTPQGTGTIFGVGVTGEAAGQILVRMDGGGFSRFSGSNLYRVEVA